MQSHDFYQLVVYFKELHDGVVCIIYLSIVANIKTIVCVASYLYTKFHIFSYWFFHQVLGDV